MQFIENCSNKYLLPQPGDSVIFANGTSGKVRAVKYVRITGKKKIKFYIQRIQYFEVPWTLIYDFYGKVNITTEYVTNIVKVIPPYGVTRNKNEIIKMIHRIIEDE